MVRLGIAMYGMYPSDEVKKKSGIIPALDLKSHITMVKKFRQAKRSATAVHLQRQEPQSLRPFQSVMVTVIQGLYRLKDMFWSGVRKPRLSAGSAWIR